MGMTLVEAINFYERQTEELYKAIPCDGCPFDKCKEEHRQLAEWLRELKALKENDDVKDVFKDCNTCKYLSLDPDDYPCDRCCHRYINQYVYDDKREVNADDCSKHS